MNVSKICRHTPADDRELSFCSLCGSILFKSVILFLYFKLATIKPNKYNYRVELDPLRIYKSIKNESCFTINKAINQGYLNRRRDLIKLLHFLINKLNFRTQTFYLALYFTDLILLSNEINNNFELIILSCLILSAKYGENDSIIPDLFNFHSLSSKFYFSLDEVRKYELVCLKILDYNLNHFTAYNYVNLFFCNGIIFEDEVITSNKPLNEEDSPNVKSTNNSSSHNTSNFVENGSKYEIVEKLYNNVKQVLFHFIEDGISCEFGNLEIACACIAIGRENVKLRTQWNVKFEEIYQIKFVDFSKCYDVIKNVLGNTSRLNKGMNKNMNNYIKFKENNLISNRSFKNKTINTISPAKKVHKKTSNKIEINELENSNDEESSNCREMPKFENIENFIVKKSDQIRAFSREKIDLIDEYNEEFEEVNKEFNEYPSTYHYRPIINELQIENQESEKKIKKIKKNFRIEMNLDEIDLMSKTKQLFLKTNKFISKLNKKEFRKPTYIKEIAIENSVKNSLLSYPHPLTANNKNKNNLTKITNINNCLNNTNMKFQSLNFNKNEPRTSTAVINQDSQFTHFNYQNFGKSNYSNIKTLKTVSTNDLSNPSNEKYSSCSNLTKIINKTAMNNNDFLNKQKGKNYNFSYEKQLVNKDLFKNNPDILKDKYSYININPNSELTYKKIKNLKEMPNNIAFDTSTYQNNLMKMNNSKKFKENSDRYTLDFLSKRFVSG